MIKKFVSKYKSISIAALVVVAASALLVTQLSPAFADTGNITMSSSAPSVVFGNTFTVTINATTDAPIMVAQAKVLYNPAVVSLQGAPDFSGSPLTNSTPDEGGGSGTYLISRFKAGTPYPSGNMVLAKLTFKSIKDTGDAGISVSKSGSVLYMYNPGGNPVDILGTTGSVSVSMQPVPVTPTGGGSGGGGSTPATNGGGSSAAPSGGESGGSAAPSGGGSSPDPSFDGLQVGTQGGSVTDPPVVEDEAQSGVNGLSIERYRRHATIGIGLAALLGGAGYIIYALQKRGSLSFLTRSSSGTHTPANNAVVYDSTKQHSSTPTPAGGKVITPQNKPPQQ